jgi:ketopantoate hydroxymethyltransferase
LCEHVKKKKMLRSTRRVTLAQKTIANDVDKSKISIKQIIDLLSMQPEGHKYLDFLDVDQEIMYTLRGRWL